MVTGLNGSRFKPKNKLWKLKKKCYKCQHLQHKVASVEYNCGCQIPQ